MSRDAWVEALTLCRARGVGDRVFKSLVDAFGSPGAALRAGRKALSEVEGVGPGIVDSILAGSTRESAVREVALLRKMDFRLIQYGEPHYPTLLSQIPDPPAVLYVAGSPEEEDGVAVAIVGSRKASTYGIRLARRLARDLAAEGVTVVSGLAQGIDAAAHQGALDGGGRTLAVFGAGLDVIYPGWNAPLAQAVRERGAWLSEVPLGGEPKAYNFPRRNRIISGLSVGVVVVEAAEKSGSLITAQAALDQGRDVFAVPGLAGAFNSQGTHRLLRAGAKLVERAEHVLEELPGRQGVSRPQPAVAPAPVLPPELVRIGTALEDVPLHIDELASRAGLPPGDAAAALMDLCLKGLAEEWPGKRYARTKEPSRER